MATVFLALVGTLVVAVTVTPFVGWYARVLGGPWNDCGNGALIVLGGSGGTEQIVGLNTYWRSFYAVHAWRCGTFQRVVVSGHGASSGMRDFLVFHGVPANLVVEEPQSSTTRENALRTKALLSSDLGPKVLLTSDYHTFRASRVFKKVGLSVTPMPVPDASKRSTRWYSRWPAFLDEAAETGKIVYYYARGWI